MRLNIKKGINFGFKHGIIYTLLINNTGVEFDDPIHRLYLLNKDASKIVYIAEYNNQNSYRTRNNAWPGNDRENGTIYSNHENINTVRKVCMHLQMEMYDKDLILTVMKMQKLY